MRSLRFVQADNILLAALGVIGMLGLLSVGSASSVLAFHTHGTPWYWLHKQLIFTLTACVICWAVTFVPLRFWHRWAPFGLLALCAVSALVLVPGIGHSAGGARRWLRLGSLSVQPSEMIKPLLICFLARSCTLAQRHNPRTVRTRWLALLLAQVPVGLVGAQDLSGGIILEMLVGAVVFCGGMRLRTLFAGILAALPFVLHAVARRPFRLRRLISYLNPWAYQASHGYQLTEALMAIGAGGLTGTGLGGSRHRLLHLPEAHTDFVLAIFAEEFGFIGMSVIFALYLVVLWRGLAIAARCRDDFAKIVALALTIAIVLPMLLHTAVVTGLVPTTGIPAPFFSYGGTHLCAEALAVGILLRAHIESHIPAAGAAASPTVPASRTVCTRVQTQVAGF